jgi:hypothetical protein
MVNLERKIRILKEAVRLFNQDGFSSGATRQILLRLSTKQLKDFVFYCLGGDLDKAFEVLEWVAHYGGYSDPKKLISSLRDEESYSKDLIQISSFREGAEPDETLDRILDLFSVWQEWKPLDIKLRPEIIKDFFSYLKGAGVSKERCVELANHRVPKFRYLNLKNSVMQGDLSVGHSIACFFSQYETPLTYQSNKMDNFDRLAFRQGKEELSNGVLVEADPDFESDVDLEDLYDKA